MKKLKKIHLTNWHYIPFKTLELEDINFLTGHSGSGKSTVIDAIQIVLLGDTNGEKFFNKAAADTSSRSLIEYLRGMKTISGGKAEYLRNENFNTYIVLEFEDMIKKEFFNLGVIFDVDVTKNKYDKIFFKLDGEMPDDRFIEGNKTLTISEFKKKYKDKADIFAINKEYRNKLLNQYMGKLNADFFDIFKKSIAFNVDTKIEDFIKNFICNKIEIDVESMQENIKLYKKLEHMIFETKKEIDYLNRINAKYSLWNDKKIELKVYEYFMAEFKRKSIKDNIEVIQEQIVLSKDLKEKFENIKDEYKKQLNILEDKNKELLILINSNDIEEISSKLETSLSNIKRDLTYLEKEKNKYKIEVQKIEQWKAIYRVDDRANILINKVLSNSIEIDEFKELRDLLDNKFDELSLEYHTNLNKIESLNKKIYNLETQIQDLKKGIKQYPEQVRSAQKIIKKELRRIYSKDIPVFILADIIDVKNKEWLNAIEGYMNSTKTNLIVSPEYSKDAIKIFKTLNPREYFSVSVVDTEKVMEKRFVPKENALSFEIETKYDYVTSYIDFILGNVIKCENEEEMRKHNIAITKECYLYKGFVFSHINPDNYKKRAYIGVHAIDNQIKELEEERDSKLDELEILQKKDKELNYNRRKFKKIEDVDNIISYRESMFKIPETLEKKREYEKMLSELDLTQIESYKNKLQENEFKIRELRDKNEDNSKNIGIEENKLSELRKKYEIEIKNLEDEEVKFNNKFSDEWIKETQAKEKLKEYLNKRINKSSSDNYMHVSRLYNNSNNQIDTFRSNLINIRQNYMLEFPNRNLSTTSYDNSQYDKLLDQLKSSSMPEYEEKVKIQKEKSYEQFKNDFLYKIRDGIEGAEEQIKQINRAISKISFGKDKYKFVVRPSSKYKNYYDMFKDKDLIMSDSLFSFNFEDKYKETIEELFDLISFTSDNVSIEEIEKVRNNIKLFSDYRTYLEFDMTAEINGQLSGDLSKTLAKNSGGETQNPLYVALLSAFIQLYRINRKDKEINQTLRLVVFDEAFSKMDAEKVSISINLMRELGLQAIIAAPNDKIGNYVESVDKTFVFNNENKNNIQISCFSKKEILEIIK